MRDIRICLNLAGSPAGSLRMRDIQMDGIDFVQLSELSITVSLVMEVFPGSLRIFWLFGFLRKMEDHFPLHGVITVASGVNSDRN